jgi:hypothetical protein
MHQNFYLKIILKKITAEGCLRLHRLNPARIFILFLLNFYFHDLNLKKLYGDTDLRLSTSQGKDPL